jgi:hyperosmotically inducible protein
MKILQVLTAAAFASVALAGCDRPGTQAAANAANTPVAGTAASTTAATPAPAATPAAAPATTADTSTPPARDTSAAAATPVTGPASANVVTDTLVTGKVKTAITADNAMKDADISVKTENGVVTLSGTAKSPDQVTLASALAQRQEGVSRVENQVAVR